MRRVLLTGATGLIGRHCLWPLVKRGFEVHAACRRAPLGGHPQVRWHKTNLLDPSQVRELAREVRATDLLHLAWITTPGVYWNSPENLRWVEAGLRLLDAFHEHGGRRIVMAGTCAEYDWNHGCCREAVTPLAPRTLYGSCKHALRLTLESFSAEVGLSSAWGRIFFVYGPHAHPARLPGSVICSLLDGRVARCTDGSQIRDFLHVSDVADALVTLLACDVQGPVNVASGRPTRLSEMILTAAELLGRRELVRLGALEALKAEPPVLLADVRRLKCEVGWSPRYELRQGLKDTIDWWKGGCRRRAS